MAAGTSAHHALPTNSSASQHAAKHASVVAMRNAWCPGVRSSNRAARICRLKPAYSLPRWLATVAVTGILSRSPDLLGIRAGGLNDDTVGRAGVSRVAISAPFATHTRAASGRWDLLREPERVVATNLDDHLAIAKPGSAA